MSWWLKVQGKPGACAELVLKDTQIPDGVKTGLASFLGLFHPGADVVVFTDGHIDKDVPGGRAQFSVEIVRRV